MLEADCNSGRRNWNIAKHLARFEFSESTRRKEDPLPKELKVSVYQPGMANGNTERPFFSATFTTVKWAPSGPLSTRYSPLDTTLVQPPLPAGDVPILCGTDTWKLCKLLIWTHRATAVWVDVTTTDENEGNAWPVVKPWRLGICLEDATIELAKANEFSV